MIPKFYQMGPQSGEEWVVFFFKKNYYFYFFKLVVVPEEILCMWGIS